MFLYSFEELINYINGDIAHSDIRIFRFFNIESLNLWVKVKNFLILKCPRQIRLSSFCTGEDLTPKFSRLYADLENIKENTLLTPLSEHIRINYSDFEKIFSKIINIQYTSNVYSVKAHLYIPVYRMKDNLKLLLAKDPRLLKNIIFLESREYDEYSLTIVSKNLKSLTLPGHILIGYKDYLTYWEENPSKPIVLCRASCTTHRSR